MDATILSTPALPDQTAAANAAPEDAFSTALQDAQLAVQSVVQSSLVTLPGSNAAATEAAPLLTEDESATISTASSPALASLFFGNGGTVATTDVAQAATPASIQQPGATLSVSTPTSASAASMGADAPDLDAESPAESPGGGSAAGALPTAEVRAAIVQAAVAPVAASLAAPDTSVQAVAQIAAVTADQLITQTTVAGQSAATVEHRWAQAFMTTYENLIRVLENSAGRGAGRAAPSDPRPRTNTSGAGSVSIVSPSPNTGTGRSSIRSSTGSTGTGSTGTGSTTILVSGSDGATPLTAEELLADEAQQAALQTQKRAQQAAAQEQAEKAEEAAAAKRQAALIAAETKQFTIYAEAATLTQVTEGDTLSWVNDASNANDQAARDAGTRTLALNQTRVSQATGGAAVPLNIGP